MRSDFLTSLIQNSTFLRFGDIDVSKRCSFLQKTIKIVWLRFIEIYYIELIIKFRRCGSLRKKLLCYTIKKVYILSMYRYLTQPKTQSTLPKDGRKWWNCVGTVLKSNFPSVAIWSVGLKWEAKKSQRASCYVVSEPLYSIPARSVDAKARQFQFNLSDRKSRWARKIGGEKKEKKKRWDKYKVQYHKKKGWIYVCKEIGKNCFKKMHRTDSAKMWLNQICVCLRPRDIHKKKTTMRWQWMA